MFIHFFAWIGWAYDLKTVSHKLLLDRINRTGDGSHEMDCGLTVDRVELKHHKNRGESDKMKVKEAQHENLYWGWGDAELKLEDLEITETIKPLL